MTAKNIIIVGLLILVLEGMAGYFYLHYSKSPKAIDLPKNIHQMASTVPQPSDTVAKKAALSLSTDTGFFKVGQNFTINVNLDTFNNETSAADLTIKYDPKLLSPVACDSAKPFLPSTLFARTVFNQIDQKQGLATMSAVADVGKFFNGRNVLTSINFKALKVGPTDVQIVFTPKETRDTNVVSGTEDILESVENYSLNILP